MPDQAPQAGQGGAPVLAPQPGPCQVFIAAVTLSDGQRAVQLTLVTTSGTMTVFLPPESIGGIVRDLQSNAQVARTGLLLAAGLPIATGANPGGNGGR